jgi:hypothetical protein
MEELEENISKLSMKELVKLIKDLTVNNSFDGPSQFIWNKEH